MNDAEFFGLLGLLIVAIIFVLVWAYVIFSMLKKD